MGRATRTASLAGASILAAILAAGCTRTEPGDDCLAPEDCPGSDSDCVVRTCAGGVCGEAHLAAGTPATSQVAGDCATRVCDVGGLSLAFDATDAPQGETCLSPWLPDGDCGAPVPPAPATSWADCSAAVDPTKKGGDLVWVNQQGMGAFECLGPGPFPFVLTAGPTGDVVVGSTCKGASALHALAVYKRLNGAGTQLALESYDLPPGGQDFSVVFRSLSIGPTNDLFLDVENICEGNATPPVCPPGFSRWEAPDGTVIPAPTSTSPLGTLETATASTATDLGCGALPAEPAGSTFITRKDAMGNCLYARSLPVPDLAATMDTQGRVVVSGQAGAGVVDLGGGPLPPVGDQDFLLGDLDPAGNHLWSRRWGAPGVGLLPPPGARAGAPPAVSTSATGDVYLLLTYSVTGSVNFGGGPIFAAPETLIVASYTASGAHRWSRAFAAQVDRAVVDGCGSLLIASGSPLFQGCTTSSFGFPPPPTIARFAP